MKHSVPERAGVGKVSGVDGRANRSGCARLLGFLEYVLSNRCSVRSIEVKLFDLLQTDKPTNGPTDQPTDRLMDMRYPFTAMGSWLLLQQRTGCIALSAVLFHIDI